jgi:hypothetical protein
MKPYDPFKIQPDVYDMRKDLEGKERPQPGSEATKKKQKPEDDDKKKKVEEEEEDPLGGKIA